jgi:hypothetical protein
LFFSDSLINLMKKKKKICLFYILLTVEKNALKMVETIN